jgi:hypothetical protein
MKTRIIKNKVRCKTCNVVLESLHRWDYVACLCGNAVDGGHDYLKRCGYPENMEELSVIEEIPD